MDIEPYRRTVRAAGAEETVTLSVIDVHTGEPRRTMVFVHGFGAAADSWRRQFPRFAGAWRLIAPDLRGHGRSDRPREGYSIESFRNDLVSVMDLLNVERAVLVAHSFGGAIAAEVAVHQRHRVEAVVLISTPAAFRLRARWRFVLGLPTPLLSVLLPLSGDRIGAPARVLRRCYRDAMLPWSGPQTLGRLTVPALVVYGDRDPTVGVRWLAETARAVPGARHLRLPGGRHLLMRDDAEEVNRAIEEFLIGVTP